MFAVSLGASVCSLLSSAQQDRMMELDPLPLEKDLEQKELDWAQFI